ncbi:MAG: M50 family metallopeptidase [Patescibacteria group bacterium]
MLFTLLVFGIVLSILVFVHEFGHFLVAKKIGVRVEEFGFGLPPKLWGFKHGETVYSLNWLPIGGFVRLSGEDEAEQVKAKLAPIELQRYFFARSKKERAAILLAGVTMNFLLAVAIFSVVFTYGLEIPGGVKVAEVVVNSPAQIAGLEKEDVGRISTKIKEKLGKTVTVTVLREGKKLDISVIPRVDPPPGEGAIGIKMEQIVKELKYPWYQAPFYGVYWGVVFSWEMATLLFDLFWRLVTFRSVPTDQIAGPIGIAQTVGAAARYGFLEVAKITGLLSLNLALVNVLPIPALDGGRLLFVVIEKFIGKRVKPKVEQIAHQVGMTFLLALIALITLNDILRNFRSK